jgi:predicted nucleotidyltransferase
MAASRIANDERLRAVAAHQPYPLLFVTVSGAHLYGFPSPDSDYDLRGVHVLPIREVVGLDPSRETVESSGIDDGLEIDLVTHDVKKFFGLLLKKNGYVLEQLYSPLLVQAMPEHEELKAIAAGCITRHHSHHYLGFARTQWVLFTKEHPRRVKPLLYVYWVLLTGIHLMRTGAAEANLVRLNDEYRLPYVDDLIARKVSGPEKSVLEDADVMVRERAYDRCSAGSSCQQTSRRALRQARTQRSAGAASLAAERRHVTSLTPDALASTLVRKHTLFCVVGYVPLNLILSLGIAV